VLPGAIGNLDELSGSATATNSDWFQISAGQGTLNVELSSLASEGELNVELYDRAGNLLTGNYRSEDTSAVSVDLDTDQDIFAFVYAQGGNYQGNLYNLAWNSAAAPSTPTINPDPQGDLPPGTPDFYEDNDVPDQAAILTGISGSLVFDQGRATATDNDWYAINAGAGNFSLELNSVAIDGELNVELYDTSGNLLGGAYGVENRSVLDVTLDSAQEVRAFVYARGDYQGNIYDLSWSGTGTGPTTPPTTTPTGSDPLPGTVDAYEDNDVPDQATILAGATGSLASLGGRATATDNDWYVINAEAGDFRVELNSVAAEGELNIELYDTSGNLLDGAYGVEDRSEINIVLDAAQDIRVFVYGPGEYQGNLYDLSWSGGADTTPTDPTGPVDPTEPTGPVDPTPPPAGGDVYEINQVPAQVSRVFTDASGALSTTDGLATATDQDFYRFDVGVGTFSVTLDSVAAEGELNIEIYDVSGNQLAANYQVQDQSTVTTTLARAQEIHVFVYAPGEYTGQTYDLAWTGIAPPPTDPTGPVDPTPPPTDPTGAPDLTSNLDVRFQTIDGFGTNLAWFYDNPFAATTETRSVFGDETFQDGFFNDLGSSIVRVDLLPFVLTNSGALAPTRADLADPVSLDGTLDENIAKFNFNARGVGHLAPALQAGVDAHGDDFRIIGSIWTPPLWLKADRGGSEPRFVREFDITGGTLDPDQYDAFGNYVVAWIKGYERETGLQFDALSIQNEPRFGDQSFNSNGYSPEGYAEALRVAREAIEQHNLENPDDLITTRLFGTEDVGLGPANLNNPSEVNGFTGAIQDYLEATDSNGVRTLDNLDIQAQHGFVSDRVELTGPRSSAIQWNNFQEYLEANGAGDQPLWQTEYSGEETVWLSRGADGNVLPTQRGALSGSAAATSTPPKPRPSGTTARTSAPTHSGLKSTATTRASWPRATSTTTAR